ncbi:hypothetical protein FQN54_003448 [Arachnomyces sp. PD_36]|nr:hypothetical protein FQN54_003448 [Arachnomyces sp. PD_36]
MSSITLKLSSLVIRTLSKPIANQIKAQAREHERFRRICVSFAQALHRADMRLRLGLLRDSAAIEKQIAREAAEAQAKKHKSQIPTVKTEAQTKAEETAEAKLRATNTGPAKPPPKPRIRPLSEAKAIDSGATFISEAFLFLVGGGLIVFESLRSRRKETSRREDVAERLTELEESERTAREGLIALEKELLRMRAKYEKDSSKHGKRVLPRDVWDVEDEEVGEEPQTWLSQVYSYLRWNKPNENEEPQRILQPKKDSQKPDEEKPRGNSETAAAKPSP